MPRGTSKTDTLLETEAEAPGFEAEAEAVKIAPRGEAVPRGTKTLAGQFPSHCWCRRGRPGVDREQCHRHVTTPGGSTVMSVGTYCSLVIMTPSVDYLLSDE